MLFSLRGNVRSHPSYRALAFIKGVVSKIARFGYLAL